MEREGGKHERRLQQSSCLGSLGVYLGEDHAETKLCAVVHVMSTKKKKKPSRAPGDGERRYYWEKVICMQFAGFGSSWNVAILGTISD